MARCSVCNAIMFGGYSDGKESYCSLPCYTFSAQRGFCHKCLRETTDESPGDTTVVNAMGTRLVGGSDRCPDCHSIVQGKRFYAVVFWWTSTRYRVIYTGTNQYVGRKVQTPADQQSFLIEARRSTMRYLEMITDPEIQNDIPPATIIATWNRWIGEPLSRYCAPVFTDQEANALRLVHDALLELIRQLPAPTASVHQLHAVKAWPRFLQSCVTASAVFMQRGKL